MELKKAIKQVAKICPRKKGQEFFRNIRLLPASNGMLARLFATDGIRVSVVAVDCTLPNMLLDADMLVKAAKESDTLLIQETGYGHVELLAGGSKYKLESKNFDSFPALPPIPEVYTPVPDWHYVTKVFHAAATEKDSTNLSCIHFTPNYVEATDKARLARVEIAGPWAGLVPASLFKSWPKGEVEVAFTATHAYFRIGSEIRIAGIQTSAYPDTASVVPTAHAGPWCLVPIAEFLNSVKRGTEVSALGMLSLEINSPNQVIIRAWEQEGKESAYHATVPVLHGSENEGMVLVNGKYLEQALKEVTTPNVKLGFGQLADPLRIESGVYIEALWQMVL